ncbi:MAG: cytochrome c, partial [Geobacteraceae bacterium]|nr:cytochrome c [Geobacteraceae bacterium]
SANTTLKITMSSLAGFTTGDFMKVRLIVSSEALLSTAAGDFSVASASLYSDIYKNDRLKGLTVVPVSVTFPTREGKSVYEARCARCHTLVQSDSAVTPSLYRKTDQVAERLKQTHHTVTLTSGELENLIAYLTAYFSGQRVF